MARVVSYDYDKSDRVLKVTDATGRQVGYDYDSAGRLEAVREDGAIRARYNYTSNGLIDRVTYAQNSGVTYSYDDSNRVSGVTHRRLNGGILQEYIYHYDRNGNRVEELILRDGQLRRSGLFGYDRVNRLNQVTYGSRTVEYDYDEVGNRIREHNLQSNTLRDFAYDDANRLTGVTQNGQAIAAYQWDAAGNVTQATESGVTWFYSYDLRQQMATVRKQATTGPPTFAGEYEYDYAKRRIGRNGVWNVYDGDELLNEFSSAPSTQNSALNSSAKSHSIMARSHLKSRVSDDFCGR